MSDTWDYVAGEPTRLAQIGEALMKGPTQKALDEQLALTRLLEALVAQDVLSYPVRIKHTHYVRPDFQLRSGEHSISIEVSKITPRNLEHAVALQNQGLPLVLAKSEFLHPGQPTLTKKRTVEKGFVIGQEVFPPSMEEIDQCWFDHFEEILLRKHQILSEADFTHGDRDWLLLWDRFGSKDWQIKKRIHRILTLLAPKWRRMPSFARVFILALDFDWTVSLSHKGGEVWTQVPIS